MTIRHRFGLVIVAATLLGGSTYLVVTSDAFVKRMVRSVLNRTVRGPATITTASFSFLHGLTIEGLEIRDPSDPLGEPAVRVDRLVANYVLRLGSGGPRVTRIQLEKPRLRARQGDDGRLTLANLLVPIESGEDAAEPPRIEVHGGQLSFQDDGLLIGGPLILSQVDAQLEASEALDSAMASKWRATLAGVSSDLGAVIVTATIERDGTVTYEGTLRSVFVNDDLLRRVRIPASEALLAMHPRGFVSVSARGVVGPGGGGVPEIDLDLKGNDFAIPLPQSPAQSAPGTTASTVAVHVDKGRLELRGDRVQVKVLEGSAEGAEWSVTGVVSNLSGQTPTAFELDTTLKALVIDDKLVARLPGVARIIADAYRVRGTVNASVHVGGDVTHPVVTVDAKLSGGSARYDGYVAADGVRHGFPWQVNEVAADVSFDGTRWLTIALTGRHGEAKVRTSGRIDFAHGDQVPELEIAAEDVPLDDELKAGFQQQGDAMWSAWAPAGIAKSISVRVVRDPHADGPFGSATEVICTFDGRADFTPSVFPLHLKGVSGELLVLAPNEGDGRSERVRLRDIRGSADGVTLRIDGTTATASANTEEELHVEASISDLAGPFNTALLDPRSRVPDTVKDVVKSFRPSGAADVVVRLASSYGTRHDTALLKLRGAAIETLRVIPMRLSGLTGDLLIDDDTASFPDLRGRLLDTTFSASGRVLTLSHGPELDAVIRAPNVPLGSPLRKALGDLAARISTVWDRLDPVGGDGIRGTRADAEVIMRPTGSTLPPLEVALTHVTGPLRPLGLEFDCVDGSLLYDGTTAKIHGLRTSIGGADVEIADAAVRIADGRLTATTSVRGLRFPEDIESLFGEGTAAKLMDAMPLRNVHGNDIAIDWDPAIDTLTWSGKVSVRPRSRRAAPDPGFAPDGTLDISPFVITMPTGAPSTFTARMTTEAFKLRAGLAIDALSGTLDLSASSNADGLSVRVTSDDATIRVDDYLFERAQLAARTSPQGFGVEIRRADFGGGTFSARVAKGGAKVDFAGELHLVGGDLRKLAGGRGDIAGSVTADVSFRKKSGAEANLEGAVALDVQDGDLGRFPVFSALLNVFPGAGNLTSGALQGDLAGRTIKIRDLVIRGPVLSLSRGRGSVTLDGALDVLLDPSLLIPYLGSIFPVQVGGTLRNPQIGLNPFGTASTVKDKPEPKPVGDVDALPGGGW